MSAAAGLAGASPPSTVAIAAIALGPALLPALPMLPGPAGYRALNREEWLTCWLPLFYSMFARIGLPLPERIRVSCSALRPARRRREGEAPAEPPASSACGLSMSYSRRRSADDTWEVFISPALDDPLQVASVLLRELVHVRLERSGRQRRFDARFIRIAKALGFDDVAAAIPGKALTRALKNTIVKLGRYPHAKLEQFDADQPPAEPTLEKLICPQCAWSVYITRKNMGKGLGYCEQHHHMQLAATARGKAAGENGKAA